MIIASSEQYSHKTASSHHKVWAIVIGSLSIRLTIKVTKPQAVITRSEFWKLFIYPQKNLSHKTASGHHKVWVRKHIMLSRHLRLKSQNRKRSSQGRDSYIYYNTNVEELSHKTASGHHKVEEYSEIVLKKKNPIFSSQNRKRSSQGRGWRLDLGYRHCKRVTKPQAVFTRSRYSKWRSI